MECGLSRFVLRALSQIANEPRLSHCTERSSDVTTPRMTILFSFISQKSPYREHQARLPAYYYRTV
jgi:hypothetical protein